MSEVFITWLMSLVLLPAQLMESTFKAMYEQIKGKEFTKLLKKRFHMMLMGLVPKCNVEFYEIINILGDIASNTTLLI